MFKWYQFPTLFDLLERRDVPRIQLILGYILTAVVMASPWVLVKDMDGAFIRLVQWKWMVTVFFAIPLLIYGITKAVPVKYRPLVRAILTIPAIILSILTCPLIN